MRYDIATVTTDNLSYKNKTFGGFISDMKEHFTGAYTRLVKVTNPESGKSGVFIFADTVKKDGDTLYWRYIDNVLGLELHIFND